MTPAQRSAQQRAHCKRIFIEQIQSKLYPRNLIVMQKFKINDLELCEEIEKLRDGIYLMRSACLINPRQQRQMMWKLAKRVYGILVAQKEREAKAA